jgi:hypothetical protein
MQQIFDSHKSWWYQAFGDIDAVLLVSLSLHRSLTTNHHVPQVKLSSKSSSAQNIPCQATQMPSAATGAASYFREFGFVSPTNQQSPCVLRTLFFSIGLTNNQQAIYLPTGPLYYAPSHHQVTNLVHHWPSKPKKNSKLLHNVWFCVSSKSEITLLLHLPNQQSTGYLSSYWPSVYVPSHHQLTNRMHHWTFKLKIPTSLNCISSS